MGVANSWHIRSQNECRSPCRTPSKGVLWRRSWSVFVARPASVDRPSVTPGATLRLASGGLTHRIGEYAAFLGSVLRSPFRMGSVAPSSMALARTMARALGRYASVVELGPGTGRITRALLNGLPTGGHILAMEIDDALRRSLAGRLEDPRLQLTGESAENLIKVLGARKVPRIVSGLPFQSLGPEVSHRILDAIRQSLTPNGRFVAFQYGRRALPHFRTHFRRVRVFGPIWGNLPPALIIICRP